MTQFTSGHEPMVRGGLDVLASTANATQPVRFSICVPQYNRTSFLIEACKSLVNQTFTSFELCIADDRSTDGRENVLIDFLYASGLDFTYAKQRVNRRYDGNLRSAIEMARGEFIFLLGNDDRLANPDVLKRIDEQLREAAPVQVAITNYRGLACGATYLRMSKTIGVTRGANCAIQQFRNFAFVSGVILYTDAAKSWATAKWDGSEMYQMYLGCRMIADGGRLLAIEDICIEKDIQIEGESVDSYAAKRIQKKDLRPVVLPMAQICPLVTDSISPYLEPRALGRASSKIASQLFLSTYLFWLVEFRRVHSWRYAVSVYRGLSPRRVLSGSPNIVARSVATCSYGVAGVIGLVIPVGIFQKLLPTLYRLAKRKL